MNASFRRGCSKERAIQPAAVMRTYAPALQRRAAVSSRIVRRALQPEALVCDRGHGRRATFAYFHLRTGAAALKNQVMRARTPLMAPVLSLGVRRSPHQTLVAPALPSLPTLAAASAWPSGALEHPCSLLVPPGLPPRTEWSVRGDDHRPRRCIPGNRPHLAAARHPCQTSNWAVDRNERTPQRRTGQGRRWLAGGWPVVGQPVVGAQRAVSRWTAWVTVSSSAVSSSIKIPGAHGDAIARSLSAHATRPRVSCPPVGPSTQGAQDI
jgi:hypothetical protein